MSVTVYPLEMSSIFFKNLSYVIIDQKTSICAVVDPAWELNKIKEILNRFDLKLTSVFITHTHMDHINLVKQLLKEFDVTIFLSEVEAQTYKYTCKNQYLLKENEAFKLGHTLVESIFTPGHTKGSICYLIDGHLFTGDTLFTQGCGLCKGFGSSPSEMFDSLTKLKSQLKPETRIYPGHSYGDSDNPGQRFDNILKKNIYLQIENRDHFIDFRMRNQGGLFQRFKRAL